jgi:hypothetical protein
MEIGFAVLGREKMDKKKYLIDPREKLAHLIVSDLPKKDQKANATAAEKLANHLIANGVTVQEWISVKDRLPSEEEYTAKAEDGTEYYVRLLIAYKTDIVEYEIGYYDGYKWMTEMPIRPIKDVVAWMLFPNLPQPPKGE